VLDRSESARLDGRAARQAIVRRRPAVCRRDQTVPSGTPSTSAISGVGEALPPNGGGWYDLGFLLGVDVWSGGSAAASRRRGQ